MNYFAWNLYIMSLESAIPMQVGMLVEGMGFTCIVLQQHLEAVAHPLVGVGRKKESC